MSVSQHISLKSLKLTLLLLLCPLFFLGQTLTGLWTGSLSNDSNSIRKDQSYEIALTEYRGKVFGYSRAEFIYHDTLYYIVKRVKGVIDGDTCEVKDDEILSNNFPKRPDKKVKVSSFFYRDKKDSVWRLAGKWKTNKTKEYYSVTGKIALQEEKDLSASKLFPHLQELNLLDDVAFYKERTKEPVPVVMKEVVPENRNEVSPDDGNTAAIIKPVVAPPQNTVKTDPKKTNAMTESARTDVAMVKPTPGRATMEKPQLPATKIMPAATVSDSTKEAIKQQNDRSTVTIKAVDQVKTPPVIQAKPTTSNPNPPTNNSIAKKDPPVQAKTETALTRTETKTVSREKSPVTQQPATMQSQTNTTVAQTKTVATKKEPDTPAKTLVAAKQSASTDTVAIAKVEPVIEKKETKPDPAADLEKLPSVVAARKSAFSQFVNFKSDSLELALYDNGEVDGDTVTIFLNGEVLLARQGLKASAIKKTIYLTPGKDDEFTLVLFADNLGKYPPNTGLLVVHDGEDVYNVRFSADFQTNAGVIFKRQKK